MCSFLFILIIFLKELSSFLLHLLPSSCFPFHSPYVFIFKFRHCEPFIQIMARDPIQSIFMSPPVGLGDILFLPWSSVRLSVRLLSQNRVRSVTQKPFEVFS